MPTKFYDKLSQDFTKLLELGEGYDVIIHVGDENGEECDNKTNHVDDGDKDLNKKIQTSFKLHSAILRFRSEYFNKELTDLTSPRNSQNVMEIRKKHIKPEVFGVIVKYLYGGIITLENLDASTIFELMVTANELFLEELVKYLESYLLDIRADWLCLNFALIHNTCYQSENLLGIQHFCKEIVTKYPDLVLNSKDFTSLQEPVLISLLGRDDVQIEESKVWDYIIKWGIVQNSTTLTPNPEQWTEVDFYRLKTTLRHCLPLIRYSRLTEDDVFNKVRPFQRIIEPSIWMELVQKFPECDVLKSPFGSPPQSSFHSLRVTPSSMISLHLESPQSPPPPPSFSEIITNEHAAQIATWIDRRFSTYTVANNPYEFKLLLRGSEHGFKNKTFHDICDSRSRTVVVIRVTGTNEILGGYNPLKWNNNVQENKNSIKNTKSRQDNWSSTKDSFIFSLNEGKCVLSRVSNPGYAFYYNARWGPNFGNHDLKMTSNYRNGKGTGCKQVNYEKPIRKSGDPFSIDDYEVFQICQRKE